VDDVTQGVTHVLRGNDHVENTYRHLFIFKAMGAKPPRYGHFPMIVNSKGKPYSKRDGDAYVGDFRSKGYVPDCLVNFLALCGWGREDGAEIMSRTTDVPVEIVLVVQAVIILLLAAQLFLQKWKHRRIVAASQRELAMTEVK
jgi:glutamyl/glutaminyl-tRNA synthetase